jgi:hypothetical protein
MAFQFAHLATYSRKGNGLGRTVSDIAAEAARLEPHREIVADMLDRLPDREAIHEAERLAGDLAPYVDLVQREKARQIATAIRRATDPTL